MPALPRIKQELFAQKVAKSAMSPMAYIPKNVIYKEVYGEHLSDKSVNSSASTLARRPEVAERIAEIIAKYNPIEDVALDLKKLRKAKRNVYHQGRLVDTEADNSTRLNAVSVALKASGAFREETFIDNRKVIFNLDASPAELDKLAAIAKRFESITSQMTSPTIAESNF